MRYLLLSVAVVVVFGLFVLFSRYQNDPAGHKMLPQKSAAQKTFWALGENWTQGQVVDPTH